MSLFDEKTLEQHVRDMDKVVHWNIIKKIKARVRAVLRKRSDNLSH